MLSQREEGLKIMVAATTSEWFFPPIPSVLFCVLWPLTFALFMFRAGNEERSPEERIEKIGRCLPCRQIQAEALADSLERNRVLEEELSQL
jgi:hypothetical protein